MVAILLNALTHIEDLSLSIAKENENDIQYRPKSFTLRVCVNINHLNVILVLLE